MSSAEPEPEPAAAPAAAPAPTAAADPSPSPHLLQGKTAVVTGGTMGIGRAIALEFVRQGCDVVVNHLGLDRAEDRAALDSLLTSAERCRRADPLAGRLDHLPGDVGDPATGAALVKHAVKCFGKEGTKEGATTTAAGGGGEGGEGGGGAGGGGGKGRLDICVSNAGVCEFADFLSLPASLLTSTIRTNLEGAFHVVQACARQMSLQSPPGGSIIGVSSISALVGGGRQAHYTPTKAGVLSLMQSCAVALGPRGIRCNALLPGTVRTRLNEQDLADPAKRAYTEGRVPLGRTGEPADVAGPAVFLACDRLSGYVNGAQLLVDGGLFVNLQ
ncbi:NAD(P)-binding protein [Xylariaceae sp. FL0804]|nr:NAD(P)-binding protein [Xylariaceae sp. FL0804]